MNKKGARDFAGRMKQRRGCSPRLVAMSRASEIYKQWPSWLRGYPQVEFRFQQCNFHAVTEILTTLIGESLPLREVLGLRQCFFTPEKS